MYSMISYDHWSYFFITWSMVIMHKMLVFIDHVFWPLSYHIMHIFVFEHMRLQFWTEIGVDAQFITSEFVFVFVFIFVFVFEHIRLQFWTDIRSYAQFITFEYRLRTYLEWPGLIAKKQDDETIMTWGCYIRIFWGSHGEICVIWYFHGLLPFCFVDKGFIKRSLRTILVPLKFALKHIFRSLSSPNPLFP